MAVSSTTATLIATIVQGCSAQGPNATGRGGGILAASSTLYLSNQTALVDNRAGSSSRADKRNALALLGTPTTYVLPAPPGRWVTGTSCAVYRDACPFQKDQTGTPVQDPACLAAHEQCKLDVNESAVVDGVSCNPTTFSQPCDWKTSPQLVGSIVHVLPQEALDEDYPFNCEAGMVGSADPTLQMSALCAGFCPAGFYCPTARTMEPRPCATGSYCPRGSSMPTPCPEGTYGGAPGLTSAFECSPCPEGSWCSAVCCTRARIPGLVCSGWRCAACPLPTWRRASRSPARRGSTRT